MRSWAESDPKQLFLESSLVSNSILRGLSVVLLPSQESKAFCVLWGSQEGGRAGGDRGWGGRVLAQILRFAMCCSVCECAEELGGDLQWTSLRPKEHPLGIDKTLLSGSTRKC